MNNSKIISEQPLANEGVDIKPLLRQEKTEIADILEALQNLAGSKYWKLVKEKVFDNEVAKANKALRNEQDQIETFRLQGELRWEDRTNLEKLIQMYRKRLENINNRLNGN